MRGFTYRPPIGMAQAEPMSAKTMAKRIRVKQARAES
jgi:hypothetical protein